MAEPLDLEAIAAEHLRQCGPCDYGLPMGCNCSQSDPRPAIARLVAEVERLREDLAAQRDVADANRADAFAYRAALKVVEAAEAWRDRVAGLILGSHELPLADAVDEWRASRGK